MSNLRRLTAVLRKPDIELPKLYSTPLKQAGNALSFNLKGIYRSNARIGK